MRLIGIASQPLDWRWCDRRRRQLAVLAAVASLCATLVYGLSAAPPRAGTTERVSLADVGVSPEEANDASTDASVSADGRYVAFTSAATNLVNASDGNQRSDVFVRDRQTGATTLVSVGVDVPQFVPKSLLPGDGEPAQFTANGTSTEPTISADGNYVAFTSTATNLVPDGDFNGEPDVYLRDLKAAGKAGAVAGCCTTLVSYSTISSGGRHPDISADSNWVAFSSQADFLDPGPAGVSKPVWDVFVWERESAEIDLVSAPPGATNGSGDSGRDHPADISADGRFIAFESLSSDLVGDDTNAVADIFVNDRRSPVAGEPGQVEERITRVSLHDDGAQLDQPSTQPSMSDDGRRIAFVSSADVDTTGAGGSDQVVLRDRDANGNGALDEDGVGATSTERLSLGLSGAPGNGRSQRPAISGDGAWVAWESSASDLVENDAECTLTISREELATRLANLLGGILSHTCVDVFVREITDRVTEIVSISSTDERGDGDSGRPAVSFAGQVIAYDSVATNLVPGDTNAKDDVFVRHRPGALSIAPDPGVFADTPIGSSALQTFTAANIGVGAVTIATVGIEGPQQAEFSLTTDSCAGQTVASDATCPVTVTFRPTAPGDRIAQLVVADDTPEGPHIVPLTGRGTAAPITPSPGLAVAPDPGNFGPVPVGAANTLRFTATSTGASPVSISDIAVDDVTGSFTLVEGSVTCPSVPIVTGDVCTVDVAFSPVTAGEASAALVFTDDAPGSPHRVSLLGTGQEAQVTLDPPLGPPGSVTMVRGTGFTPNAEVTLIWEPGIGLAQAKADADGAFEAPMLILPGDRLGPRQLRADDGTVSAAAEELVVPPAINARRFVDRG